MNPHNFKTTLPWEMNCPDYTKPCSDQWDCQPVKEWTCRRCGAHYDMMPTEKSEAQPALSEQLAFLTEGHPPTCTCVPCQSLRRILILERQTDFLNRLNAPVTEDEVSKALSNNFMLEILENFLLDRRKS